MRPLRFFHAADLHLDSPFRGHLDAAGELAPVLREATFAAWRRLVDAAIAAKADFVLLAGDLYDARDRSLRAQLALRDGLARLDAAGIRSFLVHGNHDPLSGRYAQVRLPPSAHVFDAMPAQVEVALDGSLAATVSGASYPRADVTENLARAFPKPEGPFAIGLLHANLGGDTGHANYAPCTLGELAATGHRYWALGHVHAARVERSNGAVIAYPGNLQGRSARETGPKGCLDVTVSAAGEIEARPVALDEVRWHRPQVAIDGLGSIDALEEKIDEEIRAALASPAGDDHRPAGHVFRFELIGRGALHASIALAADREDLLASLRERWLSRSTARQFAIVERIVDRTGRAVDLAQLLQEPSLVGDALRLAAEARREGPARAALLAALEPMRRKTRDLVPAPDLEKVLERASEIVVDLLEGEG